MKNFIIYEIFNESLNFSYIGSTGNFSSRKSTHKTNCKKQLKLKLYETINENGGWDNFIMRPLEKVVCENKLEARMRERWWCELLNPNLNTRKSYVSGEERESYYDENKDRFKQYYEDNKERIKQYYQDNREKRLKYQKEYIKAKLKKGIYISPEDLIAEETIPLVEEITLKINQTECVEPLELNYLDNIDAPKNTIITNTGDIAKREEKQTLESIND
jgi:group I intron endonuclease